MGQPVRFYDVVNNLLNRMKYQIANMLAQSKILAMSKSSPPTSNTNSTSPALDYHQNYINRDLSWIEFNRRVLQEAQSNYHPPLERAKFLAIFITNLDEFFMIRVSGLQEQVLAQVADVPPDGHTAAQTLDLIRKELGPLLLEHSQTWEQDIKPLLTQQGICVLNFSELNAEQQKTANDYFKRTIFPVLTPLVVDPGHPFPHISNLSLSLAVVMNGEKKRPRFARVKVPPSLPRLLPLTHCADDSHCTRCFVWLDQVIAANIGTLFPGVNVKATYAFRVTRDTDIEIQVDEADDLLMTIERQVQDRRFGSVVRLEIADDMPDDVRDILLRNLSLEVADVTRVRGPLDLSNLMELMRLPYPELKDAPLQPRVPGILKNGTDNIFDRIKKRDIWLHHPYDSFTPVVDFIRAAANDKDVLAIKQTLYRVGKDSPIVKALIEAAQNGKQVAAMVELKARFDEENNILWARALEDVGAHVVYGLPDIKVHCKVALVVRKEEDGIRRYVHLSTGNYNASTAKIYTDLGLFTCREELGEDATDLFNYLTGFSNQEKFQRLLVAPISLRTGLAQLIEREIEHHVQHGGGHIIFKMNALVDPEMVQLLYRASQVGVKIDLIIRGICCLRPGVPNLSESVRVISIVGRFLEHSRIYWFRNGGGESEDELYIGSADLMQRNLDRRVETVFPVLDAAIRNHIREEVLELQLKDNVKARELRADGRYEHLMRQANELVMDSQMELLRGR
jgi:polyphosphate kinase